MFAFIGFVAVVNHNAHAGYEIVKLKLEHKETKEISEVLHVRGDFNTGLTRDFGIALEMYPDIDRVALDSPGGNAAEAFSMARLLSDNLIKVWVPQGRICLSACAIAFTGGTDYHIQGILGFHNAYIALDDAVTPTNPQVVGAYIEGQQLGTYATSFFTSNGFSFNLQFDIAANTTPEKFLAFTTNEDFLKYYVRTDDDLSLDVLSNYYQDQQQDLKIWSDELVEYRNNQINDLELSGGTYNILDITEVFSTNLKEEPKDE